MSLMISWISKCGPGLISAYFLVFGWFHANYYENYVYLIISVLHRHHSSLHFFSYLRMYAGGFTTSVRYDCKVLFEQMIRSLVRVLRIVLFKVTFRYIYQPHILG